MSKDTETVDTKKGTRIEGSGRAPGTPNKMTAALRLEVNDIVEMYLPQIIDDLALLKPVDRVNAVLKLMTFVMPTLKAVEYKDETPRDTESKFNMNFVRRPIPTAFEQQTGEA